MNHGSDKKLLSSPEIIQTERYIIVQSEVEGCVLSFVIQIISRAAKAKVNAKFSGWEKYKIWCGANAESAISKIGGVVNSAHAKLREKAEFFAYHAIIPGMYAKSYYIGMIFIARYKIVGSIGVGMKI